MRQLLDAGRFVHLLVLSGGGRRRCLRRPRHASAFSVPMLSDPLPMPTEAELLAAFGYPYLPVRVRHRAPLAWHPLRDAAEVARYAYTDADGAPRFECIRFHHAAHDDGAVEKAFLWRRSDETGEWRWGLDGADLVPYHLPRVLAAAAVGERVFVVEGEKDVHALEAIGLTATCNPLGALQWTERHAEALRGVETIVIPDHDRAGMVHAARVVATLRGRARSAALLLLPGLERGGDVSDWLARGGTADELRRLADAAPRDPRPEELAALLGLPPGVDPLATSPEEVRMLLLGRRPPGEPAPPDPHPAFRRTAAAFARLGVPLRVPPAPPDAAVPDAHPAYRAVAAALRDAPAHQAALRDDASRVERTVHELGLFAGLLRAAGVAEPERATGEGDGDHAAFVAAPSVRLVRTRWDWDAFLADPSLAAPPETSAAWVIRIPPAGGLQMRRLHPLPAMILEICSRARTRAEIVAAVAEQVEGDPARVEALVGAQLGELRASGILAAAPRERAEGTLEEMNRLLLADEAPRSGARGLLGMLARGVGGTREYADEALDAAGGPYPLHVLDVSVDVLEQVLASARVRGAFAAELDGYWAAADAPRRVGSLTPLLDALQRVLGSREQALAPYVIAE